MPRTLALPPGWPTGKVLTDGPSSGNRPSLESRPFWFSRASAPPRPALFTPEPTPAMAASCTGPHKYNGPGLKLYEMRSFDFDREVVPTSSA